MRLRPVPLRSLLRVVLLFAAVAGAGFALWAQWAQVRHALTGVGPGPLAVSTAAALAANLGMMLAWRSLLADTGSPLPLRPAARVFFLGQLGKYVPGSVWSVLGQVELARDLRVPARRSAVAALLTLAVSLATGIAIAAATLPVALAADAARYLWVAPVLPAVAACLHPRVLNPLVGLAFRLLRRPAPEQRLSGRGLLRACGWSLAAWGCYGLHLTVLAQAAGGHGAALALAGTGAFALAWTVGLLVVIAPAGAGVRETVMVLCLAPCLPRAAALVVALVSRLLLILADLALAAAAAWAGHPGRRGTQPNPGATSTVS